MPRIDSGASDGDNGLESDGEHAMNRGGCSHRHNNCGASRRNSRNLRARCPDWPDRRCSCGLIDVACRARGGRHDGRCAARLIDDRCACRRDWRDGDCAIGIPSERRPSRPDRRNDGRPGSHELRGQSVSKRENNSIPERDIRPRQGGSSPSRRTYTKATYHGNALPVPAVCFKWNVTPNGAITGMEIFPGSA